MSRQSCVSCHGSHDSKTCWTLTMPVIVESVFNIYSEIIHQELSENDSKLKFILRVSAEFTSPTIKTLTRKCVPATSYRTSRKTDCCAIIWFFFHNNYAYILSRPPSSMVSGASLWRNLVSIIPPRGLTDLIYPGDTEEHDVLKYSILQTFRDRHIFDRRIGMSPIVQDARLTTMVATGPFPDRQTKINIIQELVLIGNELTRVTEYDINVSVQLTSVNNMIDRVVRESTKELFVYPSTKNIPAGILEIITELEIFVCNWVNNHQDFSGLNIQESTMAAMRCSRLRTVLEKVCNSTRFFQYTNNEYIHKTQREAFIAKAEETHCLDLMTTLEAFGNTLWRHTTKMEKIAKKEAKQNSKFKINVLLCVLDDKTELDSCHDECPICYDGINQENCSALNCGHKYCNNCTVSMITKTVKDNTALIRGGSLPLHPICAMCRAPMSKIDVYNSDAYTSISTMVR